MPPTMKRLVKEISRRAFDLELVYSQRSDYMRYHEEFERYPSDQPEASNPKQGETEDSDVTLDSNQPLVRAHSRK